jgi:AcrR family transcriptional regulator
VDDTRPKLRRDTQETRDRLLDVVEELLAEQGPTFTLPDLARRSGVAIATVYRHFPTVHDSHREFYLRLVDQIVDDLSQLAPKPAGRRRFNAACHHWVTLAMGWGRAARHLRSPEGIIERMRRNDPAISAFYQILAAIILELIAAGDLPEQDLDYAVLVWVTLFDERAIVDLAQGLGWTPRKIARQLGATVLGALGATTPHRAQETRTHPN